MGRLSKKEEKYIWRAILQQRTNYKIHRFNKTQHQNLQMLRESNKFRFLHIV